MSLFLIILFKVFPIYINVILGYLSSKVLKVQRESIATLLIYILGPIVVFSATLSVKIDFAVAILPIFLFVFCLRNSCKLAGIPKANKINSEFIIVNCRFLRNERDCRSPKSRPSTRYPTEATKQRKPKHVD